MLVIKLVTRSPVITSVTSHLWWVWTMNDLAIVQLPNGDIHIDGPDIYDVSQYSPLTSVT